MRKLPIQPIWPAFQLASGSLKLAMLRRVSQSYRRLHWALARTDTKFAAPKHAGCGPLVLSVWWLRQRHSPREKARGFTFALRVWLAQRRVMAR